MVGSFVTVGDLKLHCLQAGPLDGPLVLLLHGFPEYSYSWRHQIPALAAAGMRVVAPDLRGYNLSDKPAGVRSYGVDRLAGDVAALVASCGREQAAVVGHDWGGAVAWRTAMLHPARVSRLVVLDCPHPTLMARALLRDPGQLRRSGYMFFFQLPWLPERLLASGLLRHWLRRWATRDCFSELDLDRYVAAARQPGAMTAAISYYRAAFREWPRALREPPPPVGAPTLVLWGGADKILKRELNDHLDSLVAAPLRIAIIPGAGHFLQQEAPAEVNRLLLEFLGAAAPPAAARIAW